MLNRQKSSIKDDLRSKIRHENVRLGGGTEMGGQPANQGLHNAAFAANSGFAPGPDARATAATPTQLRRPQHDPQQQQYAPLNVPPRQPEQQQQQQQQQQQYNASSTPHARQPESQQQYQYASANVAARLGHQPSASTVSTRSYPAPPSTVSSIPRSGSGEGLFHQQHSNHYGADPSFISLSPSDSISNFEGRPGPGLSSMRNPPLEPSAESTAIFAQGLGDANTPLRPARSIRRQGQHPSMERTDSSSRRDMPPPSSSAAHSGRLLARKAMGAGNTYSDSNGSTAVDRHARSARLMASVMNQSDGRATPNNIRSEDDSAAGHEEDLEPPVKSYDSQKTVSPTLGSLSRESEPAVLGNVLNALTQAGRKKGQARILRGTTAEEESKRRKSERKLGMARSKSNRPLEYYVDRSDEKAFREICAVLRKVKEEWGFVVEDDFNSVSLALSLLDESSLGASKHDFADTKEMIERSLQGTVDDHYESFATAISLHNNVLQSLSSAQNGVSAARRRLRDAKEALGAKRADLVQLWNRAQVVKDSLRLLDTIETLKGVPDRLESLMSEKRFLEAVNLLVRSLKMIEKSEIAEVGATADLRGYLKGQEQAMFDILVEELHNHLYLKSFYCDSRWRSYTRGQNAIPNVDFGKEYDHETGKEEGVAIPEPVDNKASGSKDLKLFHYLKSLADRPSLDVEDMPDPFNKGTMLNGLGMGQSIDSNTALARDADAADQLQGQNPESDSFLYIEMLLESLARLGKLKLTQEILQQRLTIELHQLVDSTIDEVDARNEMLRRSSVMVLRPESLLLSNSSALARSFADNTRNSFRNSNFGRRSTSFGTSFGSSFTRLSAMETSRVDRDNETMRDLFWTLFSKLDAVLQGHRVVFEVVTKISSRGTSSAYKAVKIGKPANLLEVWRPIQNEVRTLLYEYLMDDVETTSARRNVLVSVNEILRQGTYSRDRSKGLFKLVADVGPKPGVNLSRKDFAPLRRHEEALTNALRASVPGLVGAMDGLAGVQNQAASVSIASFQQHTLMSNTRASSSSSFAGGVGGHKLLVKPDAFNISVLFQPALAFIERVKMLLPVEASGESEMEQANTTGKGFSKFLDEFVKDVFLNQLEDKVQHLLSTAVGGSDAFQEDHTSKSWNSAKPIVRSATNIIVLIDSLYSMLRTTPFHRESYSHLIVQVIVSYYQHCHERFRDLITIDSGSGSGSTNTSAIASKGASTSPSYVISATWARMPMVMTCLVEAVKPECDQSRRKQLFEMENKLELNLAAKEGAKKTSTKGSISLCDLTTSRKKLIALGNLQNSMVWVYEQLQKLKATDEDVPTTHTPRARLSLLMKPGLSIQGGVAAAKRDEESIEDILKLPMRQDMALRFQALPKTFEHLSHIILFTLRLEIRSRTIYHLDLAIHEGNYLLEEAVLEPDPQIVDLNAELAWLDEIFTDTLSSRFHSFLFDGLASLMDLQLVQAVKKIRYINRHGLTKMIRNILALQQNLRNISVIHESASINVKGEQDHKGDDDDDDDKGKTMWRQASSSSSLSNDGFEKSNKLWELIGKEPEQLLSWIKEKGPSHSFDDYKSALNLILGLENGPPVAATSPTIPTGPFSKMMAVTNTVLSSSSSAGSGGGAGPSLPGANLKPGTTMRYGGDVSRQKLNEYLIELHQVAGGTI